MSRFRLSLLLLVAVTLTADAGPDTGLPPLPWPVPPENAMPKINTPMRMVPLQPNAGPGVPLAPSPLTYFRIAGPPGSQVTFFRAGNNPETLTLPALVGMRPGYQYRCGLSNVTARPGVVYFPTFEVRGSLALNHKLRAADHPVNVAFQLDDLDKLSLGTLIEKIIVLERPENALPYQSSPDSPIEIQVPLGQKAFSEARDRGLPMGSVFLGPRTFEPREMVAPRGTIYLQTDKTLPAPDVPPNFPWTCYPLIDPILGPVHPSEYVSVYDGGDTGLPAGFDRQGKLRGVDPSDTVAEYVNNKGDKKLAISNRVALCIPRYIFVRTEITPYVRGTIANPFVAAAEKHPAIVETDYEVITRVQRWQAELARVTNRPSAIETPYGVTILGAVKNTRIRVMMQTPETLNGAKVPERFEKDGLLICKWPDRAGAGIGDLVMFTLKYTNTGNTPISNVVVVDNLTPRFEYVAGTAKTDRDGTFTFQPNQVGSQLLRWEFNADLPPGESGIVTFQVRVR